MAAFNRISMVLLIGIVWPQLLLAQPGRKQVLEGNKLYAEEKYDEANNKYRDALVNSPENPIIHFNIGSAQYKKKSYEESLKSFEKSLSIADALTQSKAYYNMGNSLYRAGKLPESILAYTQALRLNPTDEDAKYNLEFVRSQLKNQAQKQPSSNQQQQQQQQQPDQQQQPGENQDQKEEQQPEQQEQEQQQQDQQQQPSQEKDKQELNKEEAERILDALKEDEKDLQKDRKDLKTGKVRILKDW